MCGIAGLFVYGANPRLPDEETGRRMTNALIHRGPDDGGLLLAPGTMLGHRRLSIIDLSDQARQPMASEDQRFWLVFNGEIYNFRECRSELESLGHRFRSQSDTEVVLRGFIEWGKAVVHRLNGMFAFALWDRQQDQLWLVRDALGIKPLYYSTAGAFRFASEIKAILADPQFAAQPDWQGLDYYLCYGYVPAPYSGFANVRQVLPGEWLTVARDGQLHSETWYELPYESAPQVESLQDSVSRLNASLDAAVRRQMEADVPLGALLSGGLDSTAVVRSMTHGSPSKIDTFTIGFQNAHYDESTYAAEVAELFRTRHHLQTVDASAVGLLSQVVSHAEEPLADHSAIPFLILSESVRQHVKVALSGDGADELLAGYDTYRATQLAPYYRMLPLAIRHGLLRPIVQSLPVSQKKYGLSMLLERFTAGADLPFPKDHCSWRRFLSSDGRLRLLSATARASLVDDPLDIYATNLSGSPEWLSPLERQLHLDLKFHLPNDILVKVDRMSMAHSLEVRVPLLDLELVRTCLTIPAVHKRQGKRGKLVLAESLRPDLPGHLIQRRKSGFLIPLADWLRHQWQPLASSLLNETFANATQMLQWPYLKQLLDEHSTGRRDHSFVLYALMNLSLWWRMWITKEIPVATIQPVAKPLHVYRLNRLGGNS